MSEPRKQPRAKLTAEQVGALLALRPAYVLDLARKGQIPHVKIGRFTRFDADAIDAWWNARTEGDGGQRAA